MVYDNVIKYVVLFVFVVKMTGRQDTRGWIQCEALVVATLFGLVITRPRCEV